MELLKLLDNPPRAYTPIPFWFLNDRLEPDELRRQLRDFCDHGVYGVVLHPRMGMDPGVAYLSPAFFDGLRVAVETAAALDMRAVLYDEGMYPSGSACGLVVKDHPELASRGIALVFACASREEWLALPEAPAAARRIAPEFALTGEDPALCRKVYEATWTADGTGDVEVAVRAEEMAELYVNGRLCDVGFWPPQRLRIPRDALRPGVNRLRLVVTGSPANRYGNESVGYGLF